MTAIGHETGRAERVHLARPPVEEWIGMRTASYYGPTGAGLAESALFDTDGRLGRSCQSLFVDPR